MHLLPPQVVLSHLALVVISPDGRRSANLMRDLGDGLLLRLSRPLGVSARKGGPLSSALQLQQLAAVQVCGGPRRDGWCCRRCRPTSGRAWRECSGGREGGEGLLRSTQCGTMVTNLV